MHEELASLTPILLVLFCSLKICILGKHGRRSSNSFSVCLFVCLLSRIFKLAKTIDMKILWKDFISIYERKESIIFFFKKQIYENSRT